MKNIFIIVVVLVAIVFFLQFRTYSTVSQNISEQQFNVEKGDDVITIGRKLAEKDLIANRIYFYYYAWKNKLRGEITAGSYMIEPSSSIAQIVYKMTEGDAIVEKKDVKITFPEGWRMEKMAERLDENGLPGDEFLKFAQEPPSEIYETYSFLKQGVSLEGYLFPDTYFFMPNTSAQNIVEKMLDNFDLRVDKNRRNMIASQGKDLYDMIIFASIIEGEVPVGGDRKIVAGIFQNRLDIGMALQSDATIDYIKGFAEVKHTQADIEIDSPYNTYKYPGLPPNPINNPSLDAIDAAITPAQTDYIYFLNNAQTGETIFSQTLDEHNINKNKHGL